MYDVLRHLEMDIEIYILICCHKLSALILPFCINVIHALSSHSLGLKK